MSEYTPDMGKVFSIFCGPDASDELRQAEAMGRTKPVHSLLKLDDYYDVEATNAPSPFPRSISAFFRRRVEREALGTLATRVDLSTDRRASP